MYLKIGAGVFIFLGTAVVWGMWAWESDPQRASRILIIASGITLAGIYLMVSKRAAAWFKEVETKLDIEAHREFQAQHASPAAPHSTLPAAVADPTTAKSLVELEKLLYTRSISQAEFQAAKDQIFHSPGSQRNHEIADYLHKLAELHEAGVLSEVEYTAAKLRALGLG